MRKEKEIYLARVRFRELTNVESKLYADRIQYTSSYLNNSDKAASLLRNILQKYQLSFFAACLFMMMCKYFYSNDFYQTIKRAIVTCNNVIN